MDDEATKLYVEAADKNMVDKDEYPATAAVETTCVKMVAAMWNAKDPTTPSAPRPSARRKRRCSAVWR